MEMKVSDAATINSRLRMLYGRDPLTGQTKFRVVRSEDQFELRGGDHNEFYGEGKSKIFIRRTCGVVNVKKYWHFAPCWVLERVEPNTDPHTQYINKFTYEPFLTFLDKDDNPLPLNWKAVEFAIQTMLKAEKRFFSEDDHRKAEEKRMKAESDKVYGELDKPENTNPAPTFRRSSLMLDTFKTVRKLNERYEKKIVQSIMSGVK